MTPELSITRLAGAWVPTVGASLTVAVAPGVRVGGAGRIALTAPEVAAAGTDLELRFGYGGALVELARDDGGGPRIGLLLGAANADVHDPAAGTTPYSQNGAVIEPLLAWELGLAPWVAVGAVAGYRLVMGIDAPAGVDDAALRGPSLTVRLSFGPF